jgi:transcriptional repressor NF-X1
MKCHYDPCPPCEELLEKTCKCGKKTLKLVRCSRDANCGISCDTILPCKHKCGIVCHEGACDMERGVKGCGAKCKKIKDCGHPCESACHPTAPCPDNKCKVQVKITCDCGHRETLISCGDKGQVKLECDKTCANMKRFGGFVKKIDTKKPYYPPMLVRFAKNNWSFLVKVEAKLEAMVKEGQEMTDISISDNTAQRKQALYQLLSRTYCLELQFFLHVKNPSIVVRWTKDSKLPTMKLTEYLKEIESGRIRPDILPFEATIKFYNLSIIDTTDELERILKEFQEEYYLERTENKQIMAHFWKKDVAEIALRAIKKSVTNFSSAALEENLDLKAEEEKMNAAEAELKITKEGGNEEETKESDSIFAAFNK